MRRILYISNYYGGVGGIDTQVDLLCESIESEKSKKEGLKTTYETAIYSTKGNPIVRLWKFIELIFTTRKYDVLHIHGCSGWGMLPVVYGVIAGKLWWKKIIVTYHGGEASTYFKRHGAFARRWLCRADNVIVLSGYLEKIFNEYKIPCVVIPNIVTLREDIYQPKTSIAPKFISIRHLTSLYRINLIIKAYEHVLAHFPEATLDILGQGDQREELDQYVQERHLSGVRFVGQVSNEQVYDYLRANDIMLSAPSIDNMPVSLLEAMNAGVLVISSNVGGVPYMIEPQKTGLLFESGNTDEMIAQMEWALTHTKESLQMIENAKMEMQKYAWENIRKQLLPLYE